MSQHVSESNGACLRRYDMEDHHSLPWRLYHFCRSPWRAFRATPSRTPTISRSKSENYSIETRVLRNKSPFFGTCCSAIGLQVDPEKTAAVKKFPVSTSQTEVKCFLRLCSYYHRYVEKFGEIAWPLHKLTKSSPSFKWKPEAQTFFKILQARLLTTPISASLSMKNLSFQTQTQAWLQWLMFSPKFKMAKKVPFAPFPRLSLKFEQDNLRPSGNFCPLSNWYAIFDIIFWSKVYHRYGTASTAVAARLQRPCWINSPVAPKTGRFRLRGFAETRQINWISRWLVPHSSS